MFLLYNIVLTLLSPLWVPWMIIRSRRRAEKVNWTERQGNYEITLDKAAPRIWVHAVSVGEVMASLPILREVRRLMPGHKVILSVTTSSGHQAAREHTGELFDQLVYFPIDVARFQLAAMQRVRPKVVVIMETELWFNFLWAAKVFDARTMLVNGRISDRSFPRSRRLKLFYKFLLSKMDQCLMQTKTDAERILALGALSAEVVGNSKFDQAIEGLSADPDSWREQLGILADDRVVVVGSTRSALEEQVVLDALAEVAIPQLRVIHAPRHLERVAALMEEAQSRFDEVGKRSEGSKSRYLILDTYGELSQIYCVADVVVIGGGFDDLGGQNLLQPLAHGKPVLHGPHMQNFANVAQAAVSCGASKVCSSSKELGSALQELLRDPERCRQMGKAASELVRGSLGASTRYAEAIQSAATMSE